MKKTRQTKSISEGDLIAFIRKRLALDPGRVPIGPGDDAALVSSPSKRVLVTIDTIAEGTDFTMETASARQIGRKALAISLSDIAAMGGKPLFTVISAVLTRGMDERFGKELYAGISTTAKRFDCPLVGGDITTWDGKVVVTSTVTGVPAGRRAVTRSGARPGDRVFVTGELGGSIKARHLAFVPRLAEGAWLAGESPPGAMIDVSDGLGVDAGHIAAESGAALVVDGAALPVSAAARYLAARDGRTSLDHAASDGEDFELLFTLPAAKARRLAEKWPFKTRLTEIGRVEEGSGAWLADADGRRRRIDTRGYEHV